MRTRATATLAFLILPLVGAPPARAAEAIDCDVPNKDWARSAVRWIMSDDEEKEFKKLKTDEERAAFAKSFWEKRDPSPGTPLNEYHVDFCKRVEAAEKAFKAMTREGSLTDMGRTLILLGKPTKSDKDVRNYTTWTYDPDPANGITEHLQLRFAPPSEGGSLLLDRKELEKYVAAHAETRGIGLKLPQVAAAPQALAAAPAAAAAVPAPEDLSPESQRQIPMLEAVLSKGTGPNDVPFQVSCDYYAAVDGTTLTAFSVETPRDAAHGSGDSGLLPYARIVPASGEGKPMNLTGEQPFLAAPPEDDPPGSFVYQARRNLAPGSYKMAVIVEDKIVKGKMGTVVQAVDVPNFAAKEFALNGVTLLAGFTRIEEAMGPDEKEHGSGPFVVGSFRLVPRPGAVLQKSEALSFYYQVYNPAPDPSAGRFNLEATYTFFLKDGAAWKPFRKPIVKPLQGQVELYSIDLKDFLIPNQKVPADFRMEVKVTDKVTGKVAKSEIPFSVR